MSFPADWLADPAVSKRVVRTIDMHVIPPLFLLYLLAFIDRSNIGNAKIEGLETSLGMSGNDYNIALVVFFLPYILLEVPSNFVLKKVKPSTWLSLILFLWGCVTVGIGNVRTYGQLIACRFLLGALESGLFPGCVYVISSYYKRYELFKRMSIFYCAGISSGAFGGLLAYGISNMDGVGKLEGWRWIFIIEGIVTVLVGSLAKLFLPDFPESAKFLTPEESAFVTRRISDEASTQAFRMDKLDRHAWRILLTDYKIFFGAAIFMCAITTSYSGSFFLPTIIKLMGFTSAAAQVRTIPVYLVCATVTITVSALSDKLNNRWVFSLVGSCVGITGFAILLGGYDRGVSVRYFACFLTMAGAFIVQPLVVVWLQNNLSGHYKRAFGSAVQVSIGNCSGIIASFAFTEGSAPRYVSGLSVAMAMLAACFPLTLAFALCMKIDNKKRERGDFDKRFNQPPEVVNNMGDYHPDFRFIL
ncbi:major facilitator superfamily domain-containing protein [Limtongia smithiae]|uniref:major facilitator superfamily domain-containing protein n=1 Tax=Limtongia smithiae TaxID=1125753 RepID=UPI0034CE608F